MGIEREARVLDSRSVLLYNLCINVRIGRWDDGIFQFPVQMAEEIANGDTLFECSAPIRDKSNDEKLWEALMVTS